MAHGTSKGQGEGIDVEVNKTSGVGGQSIIKSP